MIFVPTPQEVVDVMLKIAKVTKNDVVYDLGSGDGRIPITAAKTYGARAVGIDIDPERIRDANENLKTSAAADRTILQRVKFLNQDLFTHRYQRGDRGDAVSAAVAEPEAAAQAEQGAEARNARRVARLRHGSGHQAEDGTGERQRADRLLLHGSD